VTLRFPDARIVADLLHDSKPTGPLISFTIDLRFGETAVIKASATK
jgi:hypothetical protein